jgi:O-antigen/teichoic acid export membrane protein
MQSLGAISSLSWQSFAYGLGIFGHQVVMYLTIPLFTSHMSKTEFGVVSVTLAFLAMIDMISNAGLPAASFRLYNDTHDTEIQAQTVGSSLLLFFTFAIIVALVVWLLAIPISELLLGEAAYAEVIRIVAIVLVFSTLVYYGVVLLRINVRPLANSMQNLIQIITQLGLALIFVILLNYSVYGYWLGQLGGVLLGFGIMVWLVRKDLIFQASRKRLKALTLYALPFIPATFAMWSLRLIDRVMVASMIGLDAVAVYEVGYKIGMIAALVILPFQAAWPQFAFTAMHKPNAANIYRDVLTFVTTGCTYVALGVIIFGADILTIMAPQTYGEASLVIPWVALAMIPFGMYPVLSIGPKIVKKPNLIAWVAIMAAALNVVLNIVLLPIWGIVGAAIATFVAYSFLSVVTYNWGKRLYTFPIDWSRLLKLSLSAFLTYLVVAQIGQLELSYLLSLLFKAIGLLLFPVIMLSAGFFTQDHLKELVKVGKSIWRKYSSGHQRDADNIIQ